MSTPTYIMETYDKHGNLQRTEQLRTMTYEEFQFELERSQLPLAEVRELNLKADPARWGRKPGSWLRSCYVA